MSFDSCEGSRSWEGRKEGFAGAFSNFGSGAGLVGCGDGGLRCGLWGLGVRALVCCSMQSSCMGRNCPRRKARGGEE